MGARPLRTLYCFITFWGLAFLPGAHYSKLCLAVPQQTICMCARPYVCVRVCQRWSSKLAQVLLFWLIFRWQAVSGGSSPACQRLTSLPSPLSSPFPSSLSFLSSLLLSLLSSCQRSGAAAVPGVQLSPRCFFSYASQTVKELFACVVFMWFAEFWHKKRTCNLI